MKRPLLKSPVKTGISAFLQTYLPILPTSISPFLTNYPYWQLLITSVVGLYGIYMAVNQDVVNEMVQFIIDNPESFTKEIVETEEFRKAFIVYADSYFKERVNEKRYMLRNILLGYVTSEDKKKYNIERLNDILRRITIETLEFLLKFKLEFLPELENKAKIELTNKVFQKRSIGFESLYSSDEKSKSSDNHYLETQLLPKLSSWKPISNWINREYSKSSNKVKLKYGIMPDEDWTSEKESLALIEKNEYEWFVHERVNELVSLGIFRIRIESSGSFGGTSGLDYSLTNFGVQFLKYI